MASSLRGRQLTRSKSSRARHRSRSLAVLREGSLPLCQLLTAPCCLTNSAIPGRCFAPCSPISLYSGPFLLLPSLNISFTIRVLLRRRRENGRYMEGLAIVRSGYDSHTDVARRAHGAHQLQSDPQDLPLAPEVAPLLPYLQSQCRAQRNRKRLRIRKGPISPFQRRRVGQDRA